MLRNPLISIKGDTLEFNADAFNLDPNAVAANYSKNHRTLYLIPLVNI